MSSKRVFFIMLGVVGLMSVLIIATVVYGDVFLRKQSDRLVALKLEDQIIEAQLASLVQAKKDIQKYSELEAIAKQIVPQEKDQARTVREIISLANQSGVSISDINFPSSTLGQAPTKAITPGATESTPTTPKPTTAPLTQVKPVEGIKDLYQLDINVNSDRSRPTNYPRLIDFLKRLEHNRRTAQVSQILIQPDSTDRRLLNFTLTVTVYIKP